MFGLLLFFNLTGVDQSTLTACPKSLSAGNRELTRNLMGFYVQVTLGFAVIASTVAFLGGPAFAEAIYANRSVGELMAAYTLISGSHQPVYSLMLLVLQSRRSMRAYTQLENGGVVIDALLIVGVVITRTGGGRAGGGVPGIGADQGGRECLVGLPRHPSAAGTKNSPRFGRY
jgi:hypothetical protein